MLYFVFVKVIAQIAGFVGIVVAGGISVNTGDGFGGVFAGFLLLGGFIGDDDVVGVDAAMGGAAVVTAVAAVTYGITGSCTALIGQINAVVFARLTLSQ
ncbi:hypothetical protein [Snodgrassella sp.]|uniref:hypothetical protein n=1 Tax=Snodgrassella sp. TaxID=2815304 RepID=UPI00258DB67D|nr:hypothetical protein [Snodgrassella sp.]MCO6519367.1 hypothetical protein [Snodgrassella sp.]